MMFDFGLEVDDFEKPDRIEGKIQEIDSRFSLIMLAEYMDESLVLLRDLLCWDWEDVVVLRVNARKPQYKERLSNDLQKRARLWNRADTLLYEHFHRRFQEKMRKYGLAQLNEDVKILRNVTNMWYNYCIQREISRNDTSDLRFQVWHPSVNGFLLTPAGLKDQTCVRLATAENPFTDALRMKLWPVQTKLRLKLVKGTLPPVHATHVGNWEFWWR